jgi:hypothetical protein
MSLSTINGKDGTADFTIGGLSYRTILDAMEFEEITEMTNSDVFSIEGVADQDPGRSQIAFSIGGLGKKGGPQAGPIQGSAAQNVAIVMTISTGCTLSFSANVTRGTFTRLVNSNARMSARGLSKGTYAFSWVLS